MASAEEETLLKLLADVDSTDSFDLAKKLEIPHQSVVGLLKSLAVAEMVAMEQNESMMYSVTDEGMQVSQQGSAEARVWAILPDTMAGLDEKLGKDASKIGVSKLAKKVKFNKDGKTVTVEKQDPNEVFVDVTKQQIEKVLACASLKDEVVQAALPKAELDELKKRKLLAVGKVAWFVAKKGPKFSLKRTKEPTDLTREMLLDGSWQTSSFKAYNFDSLGKLVEGGNLHPLLKLRQEYREIFLELGFQEMTTDNWVESSFWCFDTLFVPQQHPARDVQDTFFLKNPAVTTDHPADYLARVAKVHSEGDFGSSGYHSKFSVPETQRNVLRTHTTACSARTLYKLAQQTEFKPGKYFSIDRVFRNEEMDKTHLCEFHQIEGFVVDKDLSLANMMYVLEQFFLKIGVKKLRFKPAYNPYTEPSMEVFGYHEGLEKWIEVGNSGVFRPEMLRPMGLGPDVTAIAWGLSLERPAMMLYEFNNIHKLVGHNVEMSFVKDAPIVRITV